MKYIHKLFGLSHLLNPKIMINHISISDLAHMKQAVYSHHSVQLMIGNNFNDRSMFSELLSAYMLNDLIGLTVTKSEKEITYKCTNKKKTDYIGKIQNNTTIAVQVKRIVQPDFTKKKVNIEKIMNRANIGFDESAKYVCEHDKWNFQILHVFTNMGVTHDVIEKWLKFTETNGTLHIPFVIITHFECDEII
jgi:hypothetical protein